MAKAILISIRPEWVKKILAGEKTLEVRKTRPKLETPFKCYIYCTNSGVAMGMWGKHGKVVGEFVCDKIDCVDIPYPAFMGKLDTHWTEDSGCTYYQLHRYFYHDMAYFWHISNLKIYDNPKQLSEFKGLCRVEADCCACSYYNYTKMDCDCRTIKRSPRSWCYVEELK